MQLHTPPSPLMISIQMAAKKRTADALAGKLTKTEQAHAIRIVRAPLLRAIKRLPNIDNARAMQAFTDMIQYHYTGKTS